MLLLPTAAESQTVTDWRIIKDQTYLWRVRPRRLLINTTRHLGRCVIMKYSGFWAHQWGYQILKLLCNKRYYRQLLKLKATSYIYINIYICIYNILYIYIYIYSYYRRSGSRDGLDDVTIKTGTKEYPRSGWKLTVMFCRRAPHQRLLSG